MEPTPKTRDVFALVTNRIIEHLEQGTVPWKKPWTEAGLPRNLITGKSYRGINVWLLNALNYQYNFFLTFNQAQELGASVRAGERGHLVVFWKMEERKNETPVITGTDKKKIPFLRYYFVFNIGQIANLPEECIPFDRLQSKNDSIEVCEEIVARMPHAPEIRHMGDEAYYYPFFDFINMPSLDRFFNSESYYQTLFHELIHSTGHTKRLNRKEMQIAVPNKETYSLEELTAEMGACYLSSYSGIDRQDFTNNAAYIDTWLKRLRSDKKCLVYASAQAQRASDYILNMNQSSGEAGFTESEFLKSAAV